jgi:hypothetical protein
MTEQEPRFYAPPMVIIYENDFKPDLKPIGAGTVEIGATCSVFDAARLQIEARELESLHYSSEML